MKYTELEPEQKMHVNGVLAKFMDNYIRNNLVWTPEQMYCALYEEIEEEHRKGIYGCQMYINGEYISPYYVGSAWITSDDAKEYILNKFNSKYEKNNRLARKKSPLVERLRFGLRWDENNFYDINWGLKDGYNFEKTEIVESTEDIPWSIQHVENQLCLGYHKNLETVLKELSHSPIEIKFYTEWFRRYYSDKRNPALIPEVCGTRKMFYCYKDTKGEYSLNASKDSVPVNVRYDFAIINYKKQKLLFIELDGHEYHKTKDQRVNDSVKRAIATSHGWKMNVITGTQIHNNINDVYDMMNDFFSYE